MSERRDSSTQEINQLRRHVKALHDILHDTLGKSIVELKDNFSQACFSSFYRYAQQGESLKQKVYDKIVSNSKANPCQITDLNDEFKQFNEAGEVGAKDLSNFQFIRSIIQVGKKSLDREHALYSKISGDTSTYAYATASQLRQMYNLLLRFIRQQVKPLRNASNQALPAGTMLAENLDYFINKHRQKITIAILEDKTTGDPDFFFRLILQAPFLIDIIDGLDKGVLLNNFMVTLSKFIDGRHLKSTDNPTATLERLAQLILNRIRIEINQPKPPRYKTQSNKIPSLSKVLGLVTLNLESAMHPSVSGQVIKKIIEEIVRCTEKVKLDLKHAYELKQFLKENWGNTITINSKAFEEAFACHQNLIKRTKDPEFKRKVIQIKKEINDVSKDLAHTPAYREIKRTIHDAQKIINQSGLTLADKVTRCMALFGESCWTDFKWIKKEFKTPPLSHNHFLSKIYSEFLNALYDCLNDNLNKEVNDDRKHTYIMEEFTEIFQNILTHAKHFSHIATIANVCAEIKNIQTPDDISPLQKLAEEELPNTQYVKNIFINALRTPNNILYLKNCTPVDSYRRILDQTRLAATHNVNAMTLSNKKHKLITAYIMSDSMHDKFTLNEILYSANKFILDTHNIHTLKKLVGQFIKKVVGHGYQSTYRADALIQLKTLEHLATEHNLSTFENLQSVLNTIQKPLKVKLLEHIVQECLASRKVDIDLRIPEYIDASFLLQHLSTRYNTHHLAAVCKFIKEHFVKPNALYRNQISINALRTFVSNYILKSTPKTKTEQVIYYDMLNHFSLNLTSNVLSRFGNGDHLIIYRLITLCQKTQTDRVRQEIMNKSARLKPSTLEKLLHIWIEVWPFQEKNRLNYIALLTEIYNTHRDYLCKSGPSKMVSHLLSTCPDDNALVAKLKSYITKSSVLRVNYSISDFFNRLASVHEISKGAHSQRAVLFDMVMGFLSSKCFASDLCRSRLSLEEESKEEQTNVNFDLTLFLNRFTKKFKTLSDANQQQCFLFFIKLWFDLNLYQFSDLQMEQLTDFVKQIAFLLKSGPRADIANIIPARAAESNLFHRNYQALCHRELHQRRDSVRQWQENFIAIKQHGQMQESFNNVLHAFVNTLDIQTKYIIVNLPIRDLLLNWPNSIIVASMQDYYIANEMLSRNLLSEIRHTTEPQALRNFVTFLTMACAKLMDRHNYATAYVLYRTLKQAEKDGMFAGVQAWDDFSQAQAAHVYLEEDRPFNPAHRFDIHGLCLLHHTLKQSFPDGCPLEDNATQMLLTLAQQQRAFAKELAQADLSYWRNFQSYFKIKISPPKLALPQILNTEDVNIVLRDKNYYSSIEQIFTGPKSPFSRLKLFVRFHKKSFSTRHRISFMKNYSKALELGHMLLDNIPQTSNQSSYCMDDIQVLHTLLDTIHLKKTLYDRLGRRGKEGNALLLRILKVFERLVHYQSRLEHKRYCYSQLFMHDLIGDLMVQKKLRTTSLERLRSHKQTVKAQTLVKLKEIMQAQQVANRPTTLRTESTTLPRPLPRSFSHSLLYRSEVSMRVNRSQSLGLYNYEAANSTSNISRSTNSRSSRLSANSSLNTANPGNDSKSNLDSSSGSSSIIFGESARRSFRSI